MARKPIKKTKKTTKKKAAVPQLQGFRFGSKGREPVRLKKTPSRAKKTGKAFQESQGRKMGSFSLLRGMKDVLPEEQKYWDLVRDKVEKLGSIYGFGKIETPILEETALFRRAVGEDTDIITKEMFSFKDQGGDEVCLRPEATASVVRAYIEHGMLNRSQPQKFWYLGPMFRRDRPQAGRQRQFNQFGFEAIGAGDSVIDAQLIILFYKICEELKMDVTVQINSIGCLECRPAYKKALVDYLKVKKNFLCDDCKNRLGKNPLRILDCKNRECQKMMEEAPQIVDFLCEDCKGHFIKVLECLDECAIPYNLNSKLVRGLDYYTKTVFEIWPLFDEQKEDQLGTQGEENEKGVSTNETNMTNKTNNKDGESVASKVDPSNLALGGGGRYDGLAEILGAREETPAAGFAVGIERMILVLKKQEVKISGSKKADIFLAQLGDQAKKDFVEAF